MGQNTTIKSIGLALLTTSVLSTSAIAGGFDRGGVNIDQLFDTDRFTVAGQYTYVNADRTLSNIVREGVPAGAAPNRVDVENSFSVPRIGIKADLTDNIACLASYSEPFGADSENGFGNLLSASSTSIEFNTKDYGLTCAYKFGAGTTSVGDAFSRVIVGGSYMEADALQIRESLLFGAPPATAPQPGNTASFDVEDNTYGWRAGIAYEIPDIALRASLVYNSRYDLNFIGTQDNSQFAGGLIIDGVTFFPGIGLSTEIPEAIDLKFQTGINETTLLFASFRWQNWSEIDVVPVQNGSSDFLALEPGYEDGYTASIGIGKRINEKLRARVGLTWDNGTSTVSGSQTDTWTLSGGFAYDIKENVEWNIGAAIGISEGGTSRQLPNSIDLAGNVTSDFDTDEVYAFTTGVKFKFN